MTTLQVLTAARDLIADEDNWTKGALARDRRGQELFSVPASGLPAVRWCATGACFECAPDLDEKHMDAVFLALSDAIPGDPECLAEIGQHYHALRVSKYNDQVTCSHQEILDLFNRAIEEEKR